MSRLSLLLVLLLATSVAALGEFHATGDVSRYTLLTDQVEVRFDGGAAARVELVTADMVRVRFAPSGEFPTKSSPLLVNQRWTSAGAIVYEAGDTIYLVTSELIVLVELKPFRLNLFRRDNTPVMTDAVPGFVWDDSTGLVATRKVAEGSDAFLGLGFRGGPVNRRGRTLLMLNADNAGYGEFTDALYANYPFYYGSRDGKAYGVFLNSYAAPFFDMDSRSDGTVLFGVEKGELDYFVMSGPEPERIATLHGMLTGRTPLPPKWSLGYHQSRYSYRTESELLQVADRLRAEKIPCDVLYLDIDYMDNLRNFTWNYKSFPEPERMNQVLEDSGFKRINIVEPCVRVGDETWKELSESSLLLKDSNDKPISGSIWFGEVGWLDFTKRTARAWFSDRLKKFLAGGVTGVWNDLNEPAQNFMAHAIYDFDGNPTSDRHARNIYSVLQNEETYNSMRELRPNERPWVISRSGYSGIQRYAATWGGDALSTWDSLRVSIQISVAMGLSGQNFFGHDIGGFLGSPSPELFVRWMQFGSYIPLFRNHAGDTSDPREPWAYGETYRDMARDIVNERYRLLPYLYTVMEEGSRTGSPAVAPLWFHFPGDPETLNRSTEFMFGRSMLVAPVFEEGATTRTLYLPGAGFAWVEAATGKSYSAGQTVTVDSPLASIPVFIREGSIIPKGENVQHTGEVSRVMTLDIVPGQTSAFTLYEDDGLSFNFEKGDYLRTHVLQRRAGGNTTLSIARISGSWQPPARTWRAVFRGVPAPPSVVELNGVEIGQGTGVAGGWSYDGDGRTLTVEFPDAASAITVEVKQ